MENITRMDELDFYKDWLQKEGIPIIGGYYVKNVMDVPVEPWDRTGGLGAFLDLIGSEEKTCAYVCEILPGASLKPQRHMFEAFIYIVSGKGATTIWNEGGPKQTFEWEEGSLFAIPLNVWYQHFNGQGDKPARFLAVTGAPVYMNLFHSYDFIFNNNFVFKDRYNAESDYFSGKGKHLEVSVSGLATPQPVWETNLIKDVRSFPVPAFEHMGGGFSIMNLELSQNTMEAHISEFNVGTYKKAHRHSAGATIIIISGKGYSLMWPDDEPKQRFDWQEGSIIVPPERWWHQHFVITTTPVRQLALRWDGEKYKFGKKWGFDKDIKQGGDQIEYHDEDPDVRQMFEEELAKEGLKSKMDPGLYKKS